MYEVSFCLAAQSRFCCLTLRLLSLTALSFSRSTMSVLLTTATVTVTMTTQPTVTVVDDDDVLPRELMMREFNSSLVDRAYSNMLHRTTKNFGNHQCWNFNACLTTSDLSRGPKPRQSIQYRRQRHGGKLCKKALDGHILAMIKKRKRQGLGPWARGDTVSHLCHRPRCVRPEHLLVESMTLNNLRNKCKHAGSCGNRHIGHPPCLL